MARRKVGKIRLKMIDMLAEFGIHVDHLWIQEGGYRRKEWDLARWGGHGTWISNPKGLTDEIEGSPSPGLAVTVYSWDLMTRCVRQGFNLSCDVGGASMGWAHVEVNRKGK